MEIILNQIICIKRKKHIVVTPEELVRQKCIHWLMSKGIPLEYIEVEKSLSNWNPLSDERTDILIRHPQLDLSNGEFFALIECKSEGARSQLDMAFDQLHRYRQSISFEYGLVVGGDAMIIYDVTQDWAILSQLPNWDEYL